MARASACKLLNIPKTVPFSLSKPYFEAKLLMTLITRLEAKSFSNEKKKFFFRIILPIEKSIKPIHRTVFERPKPNKINEGIRIKIP